MVNRKQQLADLLKTAGDEKVAKETADRKAAPRLSKELRAAADMIVVEWPGSGEAGTVLTWNEFVEANEPGMEPEEIAEIAEALDTEGEYRGGGGAAAEYLLKVGGMEALMIAIDKDIPLPSRKGGFGRVRKYPWKEMQIGDSFVLMAKNMPSASGLASMSGKRLGLKFTVRAENGGGFRVWRIA